MGRRMEKISGAATVSDDQRRLTPQEGFQELKPLFPIFLHLH